MEEVKGLRPSALLILGREQVVGCQWNVGPDLVGPDKPRLHS